MSRFFKVCLIFVYSSYCIIYITNGTPVFKGLRVQQSFEGHLKPIEFKPIQIFREIWSPLGRFGFRKEIQKRDLGDVEEHVERIVEASPAPVYEDIEEAPGPDSAEPILQGLVTNINRDLPLTNEQDILVPQAIGEMYGELPPNPMEPILAQADSSPQLVEHISEQPVEYTPEQPVSVIPAQPASTPRPEGTFSEQPVIVITQPASTPLPTNIFPVQRVNYIPSQQISSPSPVDLISLRPGVTSGEMIVSPRPVLFQPAMFYPARPVPAQPFVINEVIPLFVPPPSSPAPARISEIPPVPVEGPIVRGSRIALYYGNVFWKLFSQFLTNARLEFSRQPTQSPLFN